MKILRSLFTTIFFLHAGLLFSQDTISLNTIIAKTQKLAQDYPTEKVYLHFDKPYYAVGDTIWFKGYLALGQDQPSDLSKVLYVDIISENDTLVRSLKLPVVNTSAYGSITLDPAVYRAGNYRVRAYTYWMINSEDAYFFHKNIRVGDAMNKKVNTSISLQGYDSEQAPKITANIVFKDPDGRPLANSKVNWKVISRFNTINRGKDITDASGGVSLTLTSDQKALIDTGVLETTIETSDQRQITTSFPLKNAFLGADIQFFPEGGDLIEGVTGKVAFKAIRENGLGIDVKGEILDDTGKAISVLQSQRLGMGVFSFMPEKGKSYKANLLFSNGIKKTVALPLVKSSGIILSADASRKDNLLLRVISNPAFYSANHGKNFYIIARSKSVICYAAQTILSSESFAANIPLAKFPGGIVELTLFSANGEPLTERLVFVKPAAPITLSVATDKKVYGVRQPVKMNVEAKVQNTPVEGNFSLTVINETKVPFKEDQETTILTSFLLSSELKGFIEKPNHYFNHLNEKGIADLDLLMLTQGYRKYSYKDVLADKKPLISFLSEQGMTYTGMLRSSNGLPVSRGTLKMVVPKSRFYAETITNSKGEFKFENVNIPDSAEVTISARSATAGRNMMISLNGTAFPAIRKNVNAPDESLNLDSILNPYLQNSKRQYKLSSQLLQEVIIKSTVLPKSSHKDYPTLSGLSVQADHVIDASRLQGCNVLLNCLKASLPGITYVDNNFYVSRVYNTGLKVPVQIFFNGMPVDAAYLSSILPSDVENVEVFLKDELGLINRTYNTNGVLVINSKKNDEESGDCRRVEIVVPSG